MNKKMATAGLAAGLLAGTGAGLILQMSGSAGASGVVISAVTRPVETTATDTDTKSADDAAHVAASSARLREVLKPLVDDGTITQAQADSVVTALAAAGPMGGDHGGHGDHGGRDGRGGGAGPSVVATTLGMTEAEVREAISGGQTLAQLAEAKGSTGQALIDAILAERKAHLDEEVAAGKHTQEEADAKLSEATTRITEMVNNTDATNLKGPGGHGPRNDDGGTPTADAEATART